MTDNRKQLADRLIAVEPHSASSRRQLQQELHDMFVRELTTPRRVFFAIVGIVALISATVCGSLALTEPNLPTLPRVGLAVGTLFGLAWSAVAVRTCWRGSLELRIDARRLAVMVWVFTVLTMIFFLIAGMSAEDRLLGLMLIANGLAFLIVAGVYWITYRIEQAELNTREKLLQLEVRLAELQESR
jgi:peptidoglycan/LPS O-acetylase OafA/YrhL